MRGPQARERDPPKYRHCVDPHVLLIARERPRPQSRPGALKPLGEIGATINGKAYPATERIPPPSVSSAKQGEKLLVRFIASGPHATAAS